MTTHYRREHKYNNVHEPTVFTARIRETVEFAGRHYNELVEGDRASVNAVGLAFFDPSEGWEPATAAEWERAVADATKAEHKRQAEREARRDGDVYGIEAKVSGRFSGETTERIVRATATTLIANNGAVYSRKHGRQRGSDRFSTRWIERESLAAVEEFLAGRTKVDIVAERKAAAPA